MGKHTEGPWVVLDPGQQSYLQIAQAGTFGSVAELRGLAPETEQDANARLIAAAPDLLEACAAWVRYLDDPHDQTGSHADEERLMSSMRAAIAKATAPIDSTKEAA